MPRGDATAAAWSVEISWVGVPDTGAGRRSGKRAEIGDLDARRGQALPDALDDLAHEPLRADRARVEDDLAHDLGHGGLEALRAVRGPRAGLDRAVDPGGERLGGALVDAEAHDGLDPRQTDPRERGTDRRHVHVGGRGAATPPRALPGCTS